MGARSFFNLVSVLFVLGLSSQAFADTLSFRSDFWCPYVCNPASNKPGYMVEIMRQIFEKHGHKVDVKLSNWVRAIKDTRSNKSQGLLGCSIGDAPDFVFPHKSLGLMKSAYFTLKDSTWTYNGRQSLQNKRIGVINGYSYGDSVDNLIRTRNKSFIPFSGDRPLEQIIKMIQSGRLEAFIENPVALHYALAEMNVPVDTLRVAGWVVADDPFLYVAFSPENSKSKIYADILDKGLTDLRRSGELRRILEKYNIEDWEQQKNLGTNDLSTGFLKSSLDLIHVFNTGSL